jgi:GT2 family glycosyltransferase
VVVCDNDSSDGSCEQIRCWAAGEIAATAANPGLARLSEPPAEKPIRLAFYPGPQSSLSEPCSDSPLVLIQTGSNLGFAGGCNVGLRYALARGCDYAWLLNNDTVVERDALTRLVERMDAEQQLGICGSVLLDYGAEQNVQALGGRRYSAWRARVLDHAKLLWRAETELPLQPIDYVHGASMLVSRRFLQSVGLMEEAYFLYFEELDWATRARGHFELGYAPRSVVYHKEGVSIGTNAQRLARSPLAEHYAARNRVLFTRKFYPALVPVVLGWVALSAMHRLLAGHPGKAAKIVAAAWEGLTCARALPQGPLPPTKGDHEPSSAKE